MLTLITFLLYNGCHIYKNTKQLRTPHPTAAFVPTGMSELVENLTQAFPHKHHLMFADFDSLPPPTVEEGKGEEEDARRRGACAVCVCLCGGGAMAIA